MRPSSQTPGALATVAPESSVVVCSLTGSYKSHEAEDASLFPEEWHNEALLKPLTEDPIHDPPFLHRALHVSRCQGSLPIIMAGPHDLNIETLSGTFPPDWNGPHPRNMAIAGFFYNCNKVRCAFCRVEVRGWQNGDDPWHKHKITSPCCRHLRRAMDSGMMPSPRGKRLRYYSSSAVDVLKK